MKSINTLIKMTKRELDELRKTVVILEEEKDKLITDNNSMEDQLMSEHALASLDPEMGIAFANYRRFIRGKQTEIEKSLKIIDKKLGVLQDDIEIKFGEVKKYEVLLESKIAEEKKEEHARETKELDAIAVNNFLKENEGNPT